MVVDDEALLEAMGNDEETVQAVVATFLRALNAYEAELLRCVASGADAQVTEVAHKLKGALSNLRASQATESAAALEHAAKSGRSNEIAGLASALTLRMAEVRRHFEARTPAMA
jgi:HPt (histidine-containing phosphotransfer) domain-containing protein